jgi:hypothetical protein
VTAHVSSPPAMRIHGAIAPQQTEHVLGVLPSQLQPAPAVYPAIRLMGAVLEQAVCDLATYRNATDALQRRLYLDAYAWTASGDRSHPFAFLNLCDALGYSPDAVRRRVLGAAPLRSDALGAPPGDR